MRFDPAAPASSAQPYALLQGGAEMARQMDQWDCHGRLVFNQYDYDRHNSPVSRAEFPLGSKPASVKLSGSRWAISTKVVPVSGSKALDITIRLQCRSGQLPQAAIGVELVFNHWSPANYVLMPAAVYNGNRFLARKIPYSPKLYFVQDIGPDKPVIITDVPRLNIGEGVSRIQERSGSMAVPAIGFHDATARRGFLLFTRQGNSLGDYGLGIEESRNREQAVIRLMTPVVRELHHYRICDAEFPSQDRPHDFKTGETVELSFRLDFFSAPKLQSLFDRFAGQRKLLTTPAAAHPVLPYSACLDLQEEKFNRDNFVPQHGYYSIGPRQNFLQDWQIGWTGGMISTYPLLFAGGVETRQRVVRNFDWLFPNGLAPAGFFWDAGRNGTEWIGGDIRKPHTGLFHS